RRAAPPAPRAPATRARSGRSRLFHLPALRNLAAGVGLSFEEHQRPAGVGEPPIGTAVEVLVHRRRLHRATLVGFPLVRLAVAVAVLFGAREDAVLVVLPAVDLLLVRSGGDLDALHLAVRPGEGPGVGAAILLPREADLHQPALVVVLLPAIELAVLVEIAARSHRAAAVHFGPGVDLAVLVAIVGELGQLARLLVVGRLRRLLDALLLGVGAGREAQRDRGQEQGGTHAPVRVLQGRLRVDHGFHGSAGPGG